MGSDEYVSRIDVPPQHDLSDLGDASAPFSGFAERLVPAAGHAASQRAYWTGKSEHVLSVTSRAAIRCQYNAAWTLFWRTFLGTSCPGKIEVE